MKYKITTFNARHAEGKDGANSWQYRKDFFFSFLKENKSDIYCFQEILPQTKKEIISFLDDYYSLGVCRTADYKGECSLISYNKNKFECLFYENFWLSDTPDIPGSKFTEKCFHPRICTHLKLMDLDSGDIFSVYNAHIDNENKLSQEEGLKLIAEKIKAYNSFAPTVLCGDFNMEPKEVYRYLKNAPLFDCSSLKENIPDYTYHDFGRLEKGIKIDYIFATEHFKSLNTEIFTGKKDGVYISDHYPLTACLELN